MATTNYVVKENAIPKWLLKKFEKNVNILDAALTALKESGGISYIFCKVEKNGKTSLELSNVNYKVFENSELSNASHFRNALKKYGYSHNEQWGKE